MKKIQKNKKIIFAIATTVAATVISYGVNQLVKKHIPYSYRQNPFDILDYIAGKNIFNRIASLQ